MLESAVRLLILWDILFISVMGQDTVGAECYKVKSQANHCHAELQDELNKYQRNDRSSAFMTNLAEYCMRQAVWKEMAPSCEGIHDKLKECSCGNTCLEYRKIVEFELDVKKLCHFDCPKFFAVLEMLKNCTGNSSIMFAAKTKKYTTFCSTWKEKDECIKRTATSYKCNAVFTKTMGKEMFKRLSEPHEFRWMEKIDNNLCRIGCSKREVFLLQAEECGTILQNVESFTTYSAAYCRTVPTLRLCVNRPILSRDGSCPNFRDVFESINANVSRYADFLKSKCPAFLSPILSTFATSTIISTTAGNRNNTSMSSGTTVMKSTTKNDVLPDETKSPLRAGLNVAPWKPCKNSPTNGYDNLIASSWMKILALTITPIFWRT